MIDESLQALAAAYALGSLDPAEARAFEARLDADTELRALVAELHEVTASLAAGAPARTPRPELRARVLRAVRGMPERRTMPRVIPLIVRTAARPVALAWAAAAAFMLLAGYQQIRVKRRDNQMRQLMVALDSTMQRSSVIETQLSAILGGNTRMYVLQAGAGLDTARRYGAQVFWRRDRQTWLVHAYNMPKLPAGKVYQLWYVTKGAKISAGVFHVDEGGSGVKVVSVPPEAQGAILAAMSVEPEGGSPQPTGPIVVAGSVEAPPR